MPPKHPPPPFSRPRMMLVIALILVIHVASFCQIWPFPGIILWFSGGLLGFSKGCTGITRRDLARARDNLGVHGVLTWFSQVHQTALLMIGAHRPWQCHAACWAYTQTTLAKPSVCSPVQLPSSSDWLLKSWDVERFAFKGAFKWYYRDLQLEVLTQVYKGGGISFAKLPTHQLTKNVICPSSLKISCLFSDLPDLEWTFDLIVEISTDNCTSFPKYLEFLFSWR